MPLIQASRRSFLARLKRAPWQGFKTGAATRLPVALWRLCLSSACLSHAMPRVCDLSSPHSRQVRCLRKIA